MTLAPAPAMATEPAPAEHGATKAAVIRIQSAPPVAAPEREASTPTPATDCTRGSLEPRLDQRARELASLRSQVAPLQRALEVLLSSLERAIQRLEPAAALRARAKSPQPTPPSPTQSSQAASR